MIHVTKTFLPEFQEYVKYLEGIWERNWVTNNGPLVKELESKLRSYFDIGHLSFVSNGTIAIQLAIKALGLGNKDKIITTPFSYVATTTSILWENCEPVFVDIDPNSFCIDPELIEQAIDKNTKAILATHVFGVPCDIEKIAAIAKKHNLKIIYDAAHGFGTLYKGRQLCSYGDIATISFHATKLFHTIEGGAILTHEKELAKKIDLYRSFGHKGDDYFTMGINAKNSEMHAAMGLCMLPKMNEIIKERKRICELYDSHLKGCKIIRPIIPEDTLYNYAYYPIVMETETQLFKITDKLLAKQIKPRRYFYPSLNTLPYLEHKVGCPISDSYAVRVLCLPLYLGLTQEEVKNISETVKDGLI